MENVYLSFEKNIEVISEKVLLKDIASVWCRNHSILTKIKLLPIVNGFNKESERYVISALYVVSIIEKEVPGVTINCIGESEFVVSYKPEKIRNSSVKNRITGVVKIFFITIIVFCGSMFSIMAYENDVDINGIFEKIDRWITGGEEGILNEQIAYSIGLTVGILIFYNRFCKRKCIKDPTPLDVQMRLYEDDISTSIIKKSGREGRIKDVK